MGTDAGGAPDRPSPAGHTGADVAACCAAEPVFPYLFTAASLRTSSLVQAPLANSSRLSSFVIRGDGRLRNAGSTVPGRPKGVDIAVCCPADPLFSHLVHGHPHYEHGPACGRRWQTQPGRTALRLVGTDAGGAPDRPSPVGHKTVDVAVCRAAEPLIPTLFHGHLTTNAVPRASAAGKFNQAE